MIPLLKQWQSHYGAAHREKIDTSSLAGWCFRPQTLASVNTHHYNDISMLRSPS